MSKLLPGVGHLTRAGKWVAVALTTLAAVIGFLVNARNLGLTPWLGLGGVSYANLAARRVVLTPARDTLTSIGDTLQLAATVTDQHGVSVPGATIRWASDDSAVATVDSSGAVVARGPGTAVIVASVREHVGRAVVAVRQSVSAVAFGRDTIVRIAEGSTAPLLARALDAHGHVVPGRAVAWSSADTAIVAVGAAGLASARANGHTTLTATIDGVAATIPVEITLAPASAQLVSGDGQRYPAGGRLPEAITVAVLSARGRPVPGAVVAVATAEAQGAVAPEPLTTDRGGRASVSWTLGPHPGRQHLIVTVPGLDTSVVVTAEADPVPANTRVQPARGAVPLEARAGGQLPAPVGVRVTDSSGVAAADVPVSWAAPDGGALEPLAARTDSLGEAWTRWTLGSKAGPQRARVQVGNPRTMPPFTLTATALPGPAATVAVVAGADQSGAVGAVLERPIVVQLSDRDGNPAAGAALAVHAGSGSVPETLLTADASGRVALRWTLGRAAGPQWLALLPVGAGRRDAPIRVSAAARPLEPADVAPGRAPRTVTAGRAIPAPIVFTVTDAYGNGVPDVPVVFAVTSGAVARARVMTDARGQASARWTPGRAPGSDTLTATVRGGDGPLQGTVVVRAVRGSTPR